MKKFIFASILAFAVGAMMTTADAKKPIRFGLRGGANLTNMSLKDCPLTKENQTGFYVGPTIKATIPVLGIGLDLSALYDQRGAKLTDEDGVSKTITQKNIAIPINVRYDFSLVGVVGAFVKAGPQFAFNMGDEEYKWNDTNSYTLKKSNFSVNVGLGVMILDHLEVSGTYNIACGKTADGVWDNTKAAFKSNNNSWQLGLAYYF